MSDSEFESKVKNGELAAVNRIEQYENVEDSVFPFRKLVSLFKKRYVKKYGVPISKINLEESSYIIVIEPYGYFDLVKKLGKENVAHCISKYEILLVCMCLGANKQTLQYTKHLYNIPLWIAHISSSCRS